MSGGSFDYLYLKDFDGPEQLFLMADELERRGYHSAAAHTRAICAIQPSQALRQLWMAVEWNVSGDWGPEKVEQAHGEWQQKRPWGPQPS